MHVPIRHTIAPMSFARKHVPPPSGNKFAAIVSIDPAAVADCGVAARATVGYGPDTRQLLVAPTLIYQGSVWETRLWDDLALWLADNVPRGEQALVVCEDSIFRNRTIARSVGRGLGAIEGLMHHCGFTDPTKLVWVKPAQYRKHCFPTAWASTTDRETCKQLAVSYVLGAYGETHGEDASEAVCMNDYIMLSRKDLWTLKPARGKTKS